MHCDCISECANATEMNVCVCLCEQILADVAVWSSRSAIPSPEFRLNVACSVRAHGNTLITHKRYFYGCNLINGVHLQWLFAVRNRTTTSSFIHIQCRQSETTDNWIEIKEY